MERTFPLNIGDRITGTVIKLMPFGAFVDIGRPDLMGLVELPEISWERIGHPGAVLSVGQTIEAQILAFGPNEGQMRLSIKRCLPPQSDE
jgi:small subunit ribosomal protein S1